MANFAPSIHFTKHWLGTPAAVKQAFYDELDDIIGLLDSDTDAAQYRFRHADFHQTIDALMATGEIAPARLVHSFDATPLATPAPTTLQQADLDAIEQHLYDKLSAQIDGFLDEHFTQLSNDLYHWLTTSIKNELAAYRQPDE